MTGFLKAIYLHKNLGQVQNYFKLFLTIDFQIHCIVIRVKKVILVWHLDNGHQNLALLIWKILWREFQQAQRTARPESISSSFRQNLAQKPFLFSRNCSYHTQIIVLLFHQSDLQILLHQIFLSSVTLAALCQFLSLQGLYGLILFWVLI